MLDDDFNINVFIVMMGMSTFFLTVMYIGCTVSAFNTINEHVGRNVKPDKETKIKIIMFLIPCGFIFYYIYMGIKNIRIFFNS